MRVEKASSLLIVEQVGEGVALSTSRSSQLASQHKSRADYRLKLAIHKLASDASKGAAGPAFHASLPPLWLRRVLHI